MLPVKNRWNRLSEFGKDLAMKERSEIYRTSGCIEPAPYGLFDDEYRLVTEHGSEFHLWKEAANHLFSVIHNFQMRQKLIALPELPIVSKWNTLTGVFDTESVPTVLTDLPKLVEALRVLSEHYDAYDSAGNNHGYTALSVDDLEALIAFLDHAWSRGDSVTLSER